jgi:hypothetical protein
LGLLMGLHRGLFGSYFGTKLGIIKETTYGLLKLGDT